MTDGQWDVFLNFKEAFRNKIAEWEKRIPDLIELQKTVTKQTKTPDYPLETSVVYNRDLDKITKESCIKLIVIGDNPGKDEQLSKNNRYLVGQAGKIADGFFKKNGELNIDFRTNVIILNKTPVHSAKTAHLKKIMQSGGKEVIDLIEESELWMAEKTAELHRELCRTGDTEDSKPELWLVGYSELKNKGIFTGYKDRLKECYSDGNFWDKVFVFQHFSMNRFSIDLNDFIKKENNSAPRENTKNNNKSSEDLKEMIHKVGIMHKTEIFG